MSFKLGHVVMTPGAKSILEASGAGDYVMPALRLIHRHQRGDWGDLGAEDQATNDEAVRVGDRIMSAYALGEDRLWVITEADRSSTCILRPDEY